MNKIERYEKTLIEQNILNEKSIKNRERIKANWKKQNEVRKLRRKLDPEYKHYLTLIDKKYRDKNKEKIAARRKKYINDNEQDKLRSELDHEYSNEHLLNEKKWCDKSKETKRKYYQRPDIKIKRQEYYWKWYQANKEKWKALYKSQAVKDIQINLTEIRQETETILLASTINTENNVMARPEIPKTPEIIDIILDMSEKKYDVNDNQLLAIEFKYNVSKL